MDIPKDQMIAADQASGMRGNQRNPNHDPDPEVKAQADAIKHIDAVKMATDRRDAAKEDALAIQQLIQQAEDKGQFLTHEEATQKLQTIRAKQTAFWTPQSPPPTQTPTPSGAPYLPARDTLKKKAGKKKATKKKTSKKKVSTKKPKSVEPETTNPQPSTPEVDSVADPVPVPPPAPVAVQQWSREPSGQQPDIKKVVSQVYTYLTTRRTFPIFRNALLRLGLPAWSKFRPDDKVLIETTFNDLIHDRDFVAREARRVMRFGIRFTVQRIALTVALLAGFTAWTSLEPDDHGEL